MAVLGVARADRDVVEEAEAHRAIRGRMVARRAHRAERRGESSPDYAIDRLRHGSDRPDRGVP